MRNTIGSFIILLLCCVGCKSDPESSKIFAPEVLLKHTLRNSEIFATLPEAFFKLDSLLVVISPRNGDDFGRLISLTSLKEIGKFGTRGKGPAEVVWASAFPYTEGGKDSSFMVYDLASRSVITYTLLQQGDALTMRAHDKRRVDQGHNPMQNNLKICHLGKDYFMGACFHHKDSLFSLIDSNLNQVGYFGNSPIPEPISNASDRLQGKLTASYDITLYTPLDCPYIGCYGMKEGRPVRLWEDTFSEMVYHVENNRLKWDSKRSRGQTEDVKISNRYIYILWYDDIHGHYFDRPKATSIPGAHVILVYDHGGKRIAQLKTDIELYNIELSDDERTLYALTAPDCTLVTFDLPAEYPSH